MVVFDIFIDYGVGYMYELYICLINCYIFVIVGLFNVMLGFSV